MTPPEQTAHTGRGERGAGPRILDVSAGNRAVWFDKNHRNATYVDIRPEVGPTIVAVAGGDAEDFTEGRGIGKRSRSVGPFD